MMFLPGFLETMTWGRLIEIFHEFVEASKEWSLEKGNAEARQLEKERRSLLQRLGDLEASEKKLKQTVTGLDL